MRQLPSRPQRTLKNPSEVGGIGYLTGADVVLRFRPAPPSTGVVFLRTDLQPNAEIRACIDHVTSTDRRTTLGTESASVSLVEHVLAALAGLRIDNCIVELNAPEPPGLDGSTAAFVKALHCAGTKLQDAPREVWTVDEPLAATNGGATLTLHAAADADLRISYFLDYGPIAPIMPLRCSYVLKPEQFVNEIAKSRTYLLLEEVEGLRKQGIGKRNSVRDLLVFGPNGPIENQLRYADEPARHKILDIIGDLSLLNCDLRGHLTACRSGHSLNAELARRIRDEIDCAKNEQLCAA